MLQGSVVVTEVKDLRPNQDYIIEVNQTTLVDSVIPADNGMVWLILNDGRQMGFQPDERIAIERVEEDHKLGHCGCVDYHYADCPTRSLGSDNPDYDGEPDIDPADYDGWR